MSFKCSWRYSHFEWFVYSAQTPFMTEGRKLGLIFRDVREEVTAAAAAAAKKKKHLCLCLYYNGEIASFALSVDLLLHVFLRAAKVKNR
jgi:hypothetical protein